MPAKGRTRFSTTIASPRRLPAVGAEAAMNEIARKSNLKPLSVTTGPLPASTKVYSSPEGRPDIGVPLREIALSPASGEPPFRVYDPSGPYTDATAEIDVARGLPRVREAWVRTRA